MVCGGNTIIKLKTIIDAIAISPVFADEEKTYTARLLYMILWTYMLAAPFMLLIGIALPGTLLRWVLFNAAVYTTIPVLLYLNRRGYIRFTSWLAILEPWALFTLLAFTAGGIHSPAITIYPVVIFIAGLILGTKAAIIIAGLCSVTFLGLIISERTGILTSGVLPHTPISLWVTNLALLAIVVGVQHVVNHTIQHAMGRAREEFAEKRKVDEALYDSEFRFYSLFKNSPEGIGLFRFVYDEKGDVKDYEIIDVNPRFERILNLRREDVVHKLATEIPGISEPSYLKEYLTVAETGKPSAFETFFAPMNKHLHLSVSAIGDNQYAASFFDITDRKQTEDALRGSEERFRHLVKSVTDYIYTVKVEDGYPVATLHGPGCVAVTGYSPEEYSADPDLWYRMVYEDDRRAVIDQAEAVITGKDILPLEHRIIHKNGTVRWVKNTPAPRYDKKRRLAAYDGMITDITERKKADEALRISEERFKREYEGNPIPSFTWQKKGNDFMLMNYNSAAKSATGDKAIHYIGKTASEMYSDRQDILDNLHQCYREKQIIKREVQSRHFMPGRLTALTYAFVPPDFIIVHMEDITERKKAEEALKRSEEHYRVLIEKLPEVIILFSKEGKKTYVSPGIIEMLGYSVEEYLVQDRADITHPDDMVLASITRSYIDEHPGETVQFSRRLRHKDGVWIWIEGSIRNLLEEPSVQSVVVNYHDITERKRMEEALMRSEERFRALVENSSEVIFLSDENRRRTYVSPSITKIFGYTVEEFLSGDREAFVHPDDINNKDSARSSILANPGETVVFVNRVHHKNGSWRWVESTMRNLLNEPGVRSLVANIHDITERVEAEQKLRESEERYRTVIEHSNDGIALVQEDVYIFVNQKFLDIFGYDKPEDVIGKPYLSNIHPEDLNSLTAFRREKQQGKAVPERFAFRVIRQNDQAIIQIEISVATITFLEKPSYVAFLRDITEQKEAEQKLRESEERYRTAIESSNDGVSLVKGGVFISVNRKYLEIFGYEIPEDIIGKPTSIVVHPDFREEQKEFRKRREQREAAPNRFEFKGLKRDGTEIYIDASVTETTYREEQVLFIFTRDITEHKRAEEAINRLAMIVRNSSELVNLADLEGNMIFLNEAGSKMLGIDPEDVDKTHIMDVIPGHLKNFAKAELLPALLSGGRWERELQYINLKTKAITDVHAMTFVINDPHTGQKKYLANVSLDISQRKQAEEDLRKLNAELENRVVERTAELMDLYNNAPCGYHSVDEKGNIILINDTELNMFGYERKELIGKRFGDICAEESNKIFKENASFFMKQGSIKNLEVDIIKKDGAILPVLLNAVAVKDVSGKFLYSRTTILDNSEHKEAEKEIRKLNEELEARAQKLQSINKELESFTYSVSHDLKAPLRGIDGYSKLLLEDYADKLDADGRTFIHTIRGGTAQMIQLIDDLLGYSRLERRTLVPDNILISPFVEKLLIKYADEIESRDVKLTVALLEVVLHTDADGLGVVLRNLIDNAFKFTRDVPEPAISISCNVNEDRFIIWVKDNGIGFDMTYHDKIFEIFHRLLPSEGYSGTGIGLAMARKAAERMGGRLWAESKPGKGSTFFMEIPLKLESL